MRIAIIGGGAAGMMAAATINEASPKAEVFLLEKNAELGKKVIISGGGRCNVTTGTEDIKTVLSKYPRGSKFLTSAIHHFSPTAARAWFEEHNVPLKCEDDMRVFPMSDNGKDVVGAFEKVFASHKTKVYAKHAVKGIAKTGETFTLNIANHDPLVVDRVILALGGQAYRHTGSTGDGYTLAESLGHHITKLAPSLHSFVTKEKWARTLAGISFNSASFSAPDVSKPNTLTGPFLFTHTGVSGPVVFALSSLVAFHSFSAKEPIRLHIDLLPNLSAGDLSKALVSDMQANPRKSFKNTIHHFVPLAVAEVACEACGIPVDKKNAEVSNAEREKAERWLKQIPLSGIGHGAGDEFVTAGGVDLTEVNPQTMESKITPGLYFAGEILNVDGFTGGFNLQASWATGRVAGESAGRCRN